MICHVQFLCPSFPAPLTQLSASQAACDKNKVRESIPVLFKALIANPKDAGVHRQMGRICDLLATEQQPYGGQRLMLEEMREAASSPAALSFIAQGIKVRSRAQIPMRTVYMTNVCEFVFGYSLVFAN